MTLSSMLNGNYCTLPYYEVFSIYSNKKVKDNLLEIITNGLSIKGQFNIEPSLWKALFTIPEMMLKYKKISKRYIRKSIRNFVNIISIESI